MRLLRGIHERFWHTSPQDMQRLLQAALLPRHIILEGCEAAASCPHCKKFASKLHRPQIKSHVAAHFNEYVYHDLFFAWDKNFMLLIDERLRWKTGDEIPDKEANTIVKALVNLWIRIFGPMANLVSDQEGGLVSNMGTRLLDTFGINRILVGQGGATTKGPVERHIALVKFTMFKTRELR